MNLSQQNKDLKKYLGVTVKIPKDLGDLPPGAEDWYLIPHWSSVGKTYPDAVQKAADACEKRYGKKFYNYQKGKIDDKHLRRLNPYQVVPEIVAAQLGTKYRRKSVEKARAEALANGEYLLGAYEVLVIFLTHPELITGEYYGIDCAADEWSWSGGGVFSGSCFLFFGVWDGGQALFVTGVVGVARGRFGLASGFFPQSKIENRALGTIDSLTLEARVAKLEQFAKKVNNMLILE